jgi:hypothetical protein
VAIVLLLILSGSLVFAATMRTVLIENFTDVW